MRIKMAVLEGEMRRSKARFDLSRDTSDSRDWTALLRTDCGTRPSPHPSRILNKLALTLPHFVTRHRSKNIIKAPNLSKYLSLIINP
jgi:hypothetical protein